MHLIHITPKASYLHKLSRNNVWQKRFVKFHDLTLEYGRTSTSKPSFSCDIEAIHSVQKHIEHGKTCMVIRIQPKTQEQKDLIFTSENPDVLNMWMQHLSRVMTALWNSKFAETKRLNQTLPNLPSNTLTSLSRPLSPTPESVPEVPREFRYAGIMSRLQEDRMTRAPKERRISQYSDRMSYGVLDPDFDDVLTQVAYSDAQSSYCHLSILSSESELSGTESAHESMVDSITETSEHLAPSESSELWKDLNRAKKEADKLLGVLDLALTSTEPSNSNTVSTGVIAFATYLLSINKQTRHLVSDPRVLDLDGLTRSYFQFSNQILTGLASRDKHISKATMTSFYPLDINGEGEKWEREWEIEEMKQLAHDIPGCIFSIMEDL